MADDTLLELAKYGARRSGLSVDRQENLYSTNPALRWLRSAQTNAKKKTLFVPFLLRVLRALRGKKFSWISFAVIHVPRRLPNISMWSRGNSGKPVCLADVGDPAGSRGQGCRIDAFGHEQDIGGGPMIELAEEGLDFGQVAVLAHYEFQLEIGGRVNELAGGPGMFSLWRSLASRRIGLLRGSVGVELESLGESEAKSRSSGMKTVPAVSMVMCLPADFRAAADRGDIGHDHRLAAGEHDMLRGVGERALAGRSFRRGRFRLRGSSLHKACRAPGAAEVSARWARTKTLGTPASFPSPCIEKNSSASFIGI